MENKFIRNCPKCNTILTYKSKYTWQKATSKNSWCKSCVVRAEYVHNPNKNKGNNNGRFGKKSLQVWIDKYGKDLGTQKYEATFKTHPNRKFFKCGKENPAYGRVYNSSRSYKGWYKSLFFRSSLELFFILDYELKNSSLPKTAESKSFRVQYLTEKGSNRTYVPDFYCPINNEVIEVKADYFKNNYEVQQKASAFKVKSNLTYILFTENDLTHFPCLSYNETKKYLLSAHSKQIIKLTDKTLNQINKKGKLLCSMF